MDSIAVPLYKRPSVALKFCGSCEFRIVESAPSWATPLTAPSFVKEIAPTTEFKSHRGSLI